MVFVNKISMVDQFRLQRFEKRFGYRVIPAVSLAAHALNNAVGFSHLSKGFTAVLNVAMKGIGQNPQACPFRRYVSARGLK